MFSKTKFKGLNEIISHVMKRIQGLIKFMRNPRVVQENVVFLMEK
jgi:hypothetical protein